MKTLKRTWAEVSLDNLEHNYRAIKNHIPEGCRFLGVMKADAYGHGAVPLSHALCELGAEYLAVSNLEEAIQLRRGGVRAPMLILGYTPASFADTMVFMDITQEVHSLEYAKELDTALAGTNYILNVHLKLDTGMTRIGFFAYDHERTLPELLEVCGLPHLHVEGVFTHFCVADSKAPEDEAFTRTQYARFTAMLDALAAHGIRPELRHCASSGATILYPELALDMVRPGIATYGHAPSEDAEGILDLRPLMTVRTTVAQLREIPAGTSISYGRTYTAERDMRVAVLPIGYADGLLRGLSGKVSFRIRGRMARSVGRICMDMCMVDVSEIPGIRVGDEAALFGYDTDGTLLPCERIAQQAGTISYEILCGISKRIPRIYMQDGREQEILQYIV
ncbi:alanine racemase [Firmicutes bacterium CAG:170]|jgi:alanine racemase|nr:alanine racemase [Firmicutes bacterium CAG:170]